MPEGQWTFSRARDEYVGKEGVIGYRGRNRGNQTWYNHMSAAKIKDRIGTTLWDSYFKFTVIRNPFDKLISGYYWQEKRIKEYTTAEKIRVFARKLGGKAHSRDYITGTSQIERFRSWIRNGGALLDRNKYIINGEICIDFFIRYEDLDNGIKHVCNKLGIAFEPENIPRLKSGIRNNRFSISDYYDTETIHIVSKLYQFELDYFGYPSPSIR